MSDSYAFLHESPPDDTTPAKLAFAASADAETKRREALAAARIRAIVGMEVQRLRGDKFADQIDTPEQTLEGYAPGYGPDATARQIERVYGDFDYYPGWANPSQYAQAVMARDPSERAANERFMLSRHQYPYMQKVGRVVDLLRDLRTPSGQEKPTGAFFAGNREALSGPNQAALHYWDKSNNATRSREDYPDPNYSRWAGADRAAPVFMDDSSSDLARYVQTASIIPHAIKSSFETSAEAPARDAVLASVMPGVEKTLLYALMPGAAPAGELIYRASRGDNPKVGEAMQRAANAYNVRDRFRVTGEGGEILDLPAEGSQPGGAGAYRKAYRARRQEAREMLGATNPYPTQNVANDIFAGIHKHIPLYEGEYRGVPAVVGDGVGIFVDAADPSLGAGLSVGAAGRYAATKAAGRPSMLSAVARESWQQLYPEAGLGGGLNYATSGAAGGRSWPEYYTKPDPGVNMDAPAPDSPTQTLREWRNDVNNRVEQLHRTDPQSIRKTFQDALREEALRRPVGAAAQPIYGAR